MPDGLHWDVLGSTGGPRGLRAAARAAADSWSLGVDAWAVDYGLLDDGRLLVGDAVPLPRRPDRRPSRRVHAVVPQAELYERNGLQFLPFNTIYQLAARAGPRLGPRPAHAALPDLLGYRLTGAHVTERTNASTTGLLDARTGARGTTT